MTVWKLATGCVFGLIGCAPPPAVAIPTGDAEQPTIEMLYPPADIGEVVLDASGVLSVLVVVDIEGFEFTEPYLPMTEDNPEVDDDSAGHWHLKFNGVYAAAPPGPSFTFRSQPGEFPAGRSLSIGVTLAQHDHDELEGFEASSDVIEVQVVQAGAE